MAKSKKPDLSTTPDLVVSEDEPDDRQDPEGAEGVKKLRLIGMILSSRHP